MQHDDPHDDAIYVLQVAAAAPADPRSVRKYLRGEPVRGLAGDRIARAIRLRDHAADAAQPAGAR